MTYPSDLNTLVDQLAIAKAKLSHAEEAVEKMKALQLEVDRMQSRLIDILDKAGFSEDAVGLLLAAR